MSDNEANAGNLESPKSPLDDLRAREEKSTIDTLANAERVKEIGPRTAEEMLLEALAGQTSSGRKLTFTQQCGAFAALYSGVRNQVVARAFGISVQCASFISGCLDNDPAPYRTIVKDVGNGVIEKETIMWDHNRNRKPSRRKRYEDVGREFEALGKDAFLARYYTPRVHNKIVLAQHELHAEKQKRK